MPVTHGVASSSLVQTANPNQASLSPNGWGTFAFPRTYQSAYMADLNASDT